MVFGKSITFEENGVSDAAHAARSDSAFTTAENEFLDRLRAGETDAFDTLVCRYSGDIFALLVRITQNPDEAGDLTQDTFLRAFKAIRRFRGDSELKTWLFRIAINESRNRHRWWKRRFREKTVSLDDPVGDTDVRLHETLSMAPPIRKLSCFAASITGPSNSHLRQSPRRTAKLSCYGISRAKAIRR